MANLRNNSGSPAAARSGESMREVRDRWAGEISGPEGSWGELPPMSGQTGQMGQWNGGPGIGMPPSGSMTPPWSVPQADGMEQNGAQPWSGGLQMSRNGQPPRTDGLNMNNLLPSEVIESPTTMNEAYLGSLKSMLLRNKGNYIVATFLVGTQGTVSWEGILYEVGNDYVTIYQPGRDRYIVSDMYSLRYMEFYDIQRRELCNQLLRERGWQTSSW